MADHSRPRGTRRCEEAREMPSVTASESPSVWLIRERQLEKERRKARGENLSSGEKNPPWKPLSDLPGSDI